MISRGRSAFAGRPCLGPADDPAARGGAVLPRSLGMRTGYSLERLASSFLTYVSWLRPAVSPSATCLDSARFLGVVSAPGIKPVARREGVYTSPQSRNPPPLRVHGTWGGSDEEPSHPYVLDSHVGCAILGGADSGPGELGRQWSLMDQSYQSRLCPSCRQPAKSAPTVGMPYAQESSPQPM